MTPDEARAPKPKPTSALRRPCPKCPFRTDIAGYLRVERVRGIAESLFRGGTFSCHQTVDYEAEASERGRLGNSELQCAGSEIFLAHQGISTQISRIEERLGMKVATLDMDAPVFRSLRDWEAAQPDYEEPGETCSVVDAGCEAPAGFMVGGGVVDGDVYVDTCCAECGEPVCGSCQKDGVCNTCRETED